MDRNHISHIRFYRPGPRARLAPKGRADTSLPIPIEETYPVRRNKGPLARYYYLPIFATRSPRFKHVYICLRCTHPHTQQSNNRIQTRGGRPPPHIHTHAHRQPRNLFQCGTSPFRSSLLALDLHKQHTHTHIRITRHSNPVPTLPATSPLN